MAWHTLTTVQGDKWIHLRMNSKDYNVNKRTFCKNLHKLFLANIFLFRRLTKKNTESNNKILYYTTTCDTILLWYCWNERIRWVEFLPLFSPYKYTIATKRLCDYTTECHSDITKGTTFYTGGVKTIVWKQNKNITISVLSFKCWFILFVLFYNVFSLCNYKYVGKLFGPVALNVLACKIQTFICLNKVTRIEENKFCFWRFYFHVVVTRRSCSILRS